MTVDETSLAKLKAASYEDREPVGSCSSHMRHHVQNRTGRQPCLNSTPVCRYKEKASFESKWVRIDKRRQNWNILLLLYWKLHYYQLLDIERDQFIFIWALSGTDVQGKLRSRALFIRYVINFPTKPWYKEVYFHQDVRSLPDENRYVFTRIKGIRTYLVISAFLMRMGCVAGWGWVVRWRLREKVRKRKKWKEREKEK